MGLERRAELRGTESGRVMMALDVFNHDLVGLQMRCGVFAIALTTVNSIYVSSEKRNHGAACCQRRH